MALARFPTGDTAIRISIAMMVVVAFALVLRIWARFKHKSTLLIEDWLILAAAALFYAYNGVLIDAVTNKDSSGSLNMYEMEVPQLNNWQLHLFVIELQFTTAITLIKVSILFFYRHIFATAKFKMATTAMIALCCLWCFITLFIVIFQCVPVYVFWNVIQQVPYGPVQCISAINLIFGFEVSNVIIDIAILAMPVSVIGTLKLPTAKKVTISAIFLLGSFVCVTCAVRTYWVYDPVNNDARSLPGVMDWTTIELASAIICACLPTYGPLFSNSPVIATFKTWYSSFLSSVGLSKGSRGSSGGKSGISSRGKAAVNPGRRYNQLSDNGTDKQPITSVRGGTYSEDGAYHNGVEMNRIHVRETVDVD